jgi:hypothetical protein
MQQIIGISDGIGLGASTPGGGDILDGGKIGRAQHDRRRHTRRQTATREGITSWELGRVVP